MTPISPLQPECTKYDDCPFDKSCVNQKCVSPCSLADSCGRGSFCHAQNHQPVCRCPNGYTGDPRVACNPRKYLLNFKIINFLTMFLSISQFIHGLQHLYHHLSVYQAQNVVLRNHVLTNCV